MKSLTVYYDENIQLQTRLEDIPIPASRHHEVRIKVSVAASNPKDWKHPHPDYINIAVNQGDDCAGTVNAVGPDMRNFKLGDRVAGFHVMAAEHGTYAEYAICSGEHRLPFVEARQRRRRRDDTARRIHGGGGLVQKSETTYAIREERRLEFPDAEGAARCEWGGIRDISPIIGTAGESQKFVKCVGADVVVDYRSKSAVEDLRTALGGAEWYHVFDAANTPASTEYVTAVLGKNGALTYTQRASPEDVALLDEAEIWHEQIWVGSVHETKLAGGKWVGAVMSRVFEMALTEKKLSGQPYQVVPNRLDGVRGALYLLRDRKGGNANFVCRITATPGL
ncbi:hypothetical protein LTR66_012106 [Elasticomyces elasticus]|nr:hypothetical protein LTR66_012106 [Elasticomyces elasticus]